MAQPQTGPDNIRILSVVWYKVLPPLFGGQKGVALFNEYLGRLAPLTCLCSKNNGLQNTSYMIEASLPVGKSQFFNPRCWRKIFRSAKRIRATHIILEFPYYGMAGLLCQKLLRTKLVLHAHNVEALRFREQGKGWWKALFFLERLAMKTADFIFFKTEKDREKAIATYGIDSRKTGLVPYGVEPKGTINKLASKEILIQRHRFSPEAKLLLFAATLDYGPNAFAMKSMVGKLIPLLNQKAINYKILVCGRIVFRGFNYLKDIRNNNLIFAGNVTDIETYFAAADVFIDPVLSNSGVQTKMVDALNFGLNVVCFDGMQEGIAGAENKIFAAQKNDWAAFADATVKALSHDEPTRNAFFEHHNWVTIAANAFQHLQKS
jgi:polysaccharide biosynthesis protein PslH